MTNSVGVPIKLLHESQGLVVTIELKNGQTYRGRLEEVEDNMNVQLKSVTVTSREGAVSLMETVFIRGSSIRFFIVPDNMRYAPFFNRLKPRIKTHVPGMGPARIHRGLGMAGQRG